MKTAYDNFHKFVSTYFHKLSNRTYKQLIACTITINIIFAIKIAYANLYISAYHDKCLCYYELQTSSLSKQALILVAQVIPRSLNSFLIDS